MLPIWLVGCFGFNGPLRQYFSLYRAEMLPNVTEHVIQELYITSEDFCRKIQAAIEEYDKHLTSGQGTKTKVVLPHLKGF